MDFQVLSFILRGRRAIDRRELGVPRQQGPLQPSHIFIRREFLDAAELPCRKSSETAEMRAEWQIHLQHLLIEALSSLI